MSPPAILLTGVGKRYDIVSCFARLTKTVVVDPAPLAPAQYAAHVRASAPLVDDPAYVPALQSLCAEHRVGAVLPLTDLDIEVLARAREEGRLPALVPSAQVARATYDKYEAHLLLERLGLPSPPTALPEQDLDALRYPVMVKPRRGSGARSIHLARDAAQARFFIDYVREPTMVQRAMGGPEMSIDCLGDLDGRCLNAIPRTMLESRGGESIKGTVVQDAELTELARSTMQALRVRGPATIQVFRDPDIGVAITDVNTRFGGAFLRAGARRAARAHLPRADRRPRRRRDGRTPRRRVQRRRHLHALLLAARARRADAPDRTRHSPRRAAAPALSGDPAFRAAPRARIALHGHRRCGPTRARAPAAGARCRRVRARTRGRRARGRAAQVRQLRRGDGARPGLVPAVRRRRPGRAEHEVPRLALGRARPRGHRDPRARGRRGGIRGDHRTDGARTENRDGRPGAGAGHHARRSRRASDNGRAGAGDPLAGDQHAAAGRAGQTAENPAHGGHPQNHHDAGQNDARGQKPVDHADQNHARVEPTPQQPAILLDTNAASTYNPSNLPATSFGEPSLAIDGDTATGWSAQVEPATAPNMTAGLLIDLKDTQRLSAMEVITPTPGMTVQVFGSSAATAPTTITDPGWTALTKSEVLKTRHVRVKLSDTTTGFRFVTLWISKAPASAVGTPQAPGRVSVNEVELFAAAK